MFDVVRYLDRILACRVDIIAPAPELPVLVFELQFGKPFLQLQATLPF